MIIDEDKDMDLGLALSYPNQSQHTRLNTTSGAGTNADSRIDMAFVASDPLSELVWSPHRGLSLIRAEGSVTERKPSCMCNVEPNKLVLSATHSISSRGTNDNKPIGERRLTATEGKFHVDSEAAKGGAYLAKSPGRCPSPVFGSSPGDHSGSGSSMEEVNPAEEESIVHFNQTQESNNKEKALCSPKGIQFQNMAITCKTDAGQESQRTADFLLMLTNESKHEVTSGEDIITSGRIKDVASGSQILGIEIALASEGHITKQRDVLDDPVSNSSVQRRTREESAIIERHGSNNALLKGLGSSAENDVNLIVKDACGQSEERYRMDKSFPVEVSGTPSNSRIHLLQGKGKEKALFGTYVNERISKDEDDSHYNTESCNSASLFLKGKSRWSFEQQLIVGNKRIKRQIQEASTSTSLVKQDSSFMNWISNMVKGFAKSNQYECPLALNLNHPNHGPKRDDQKNITCDKTHEFGSGNMGFQSIFQSLYCPNTKLSEKRMSNADYPVSSAKELVEAEKTYISKMPISFFTQNDESCKEFLVENNNFNNDKPRKSGGMSTELSSQPRIVSSNIASSQETCKTNSENKNLSSLARIKEKDEVCSSDTFLGKQNIVSAEDNSLQSPSEVKTIPDNGNKNDPLRSSWINCIYPKTPRLVLNLDSCSSTHVMLEHSAGCTMDIPQNHINCSLHQKKSHDAAEEYPCLCIKCFQLGHWAIACPVASSSRQRQSDNNAPVVNHCNAGTVQLHKGSEPYSNMFVAKESHSQVAAEDSTCNRKKPRMENDLSFSPIPKGKLVSERKVFCLDEVQNHISPSYREVELKENQIPPLRNSSSEHISDAANIFDVIRGLRLSRRDILKWMNSHMSLSRLNGFFLRLRLWNWEKGLGGAGYYVACINETRREKTSKGSKNSIYVSVGGIKCLVESQYVSNHEFSEDELMAWWQTTSRSGELPTKEYLRSKFEERKTLGF